MTLDELRKYHDQIKRDLDFNNESNKTIGKYGGISWSNKSNQVYQEDYPKFRNKLIEFIQENVTDEFRKEELIKKANEHALIYIRKPQDPHQKSTAEDIMDILEDITES